MLSIDADYYQQSTQIWLKVITWETTPIESDEPLWICSEGGFMTKHLQNHFFAARSLQSNSKKGLESCWQEFFKSSLEMRSRFFCLWFILRIYTQWSTCSLIISQNFKENLFRRRWKKYKFMLSFLFLMIQHSNFHMTCSAQQKKSSSSFLFWQILLLRL